MANHISSVPAAGIKQVTKSQFYQLLQPGDLIFCWGREEISKIIEGITNGPSHVLMAWTPGTWAGQWLTLESTFQRGVHVGLLADYVDKYDGYIVMARRPKLTNLDIFNELARGFTLLDYTYDWQSEVSQAAQKLIKSLPLLKPDKALYCSALQYSMSLATHFPLQRPAANYPTPEDNWTDLTVEAVCALRYPASPT